MFDSTTPLDSPDGLSGEEEAQATRDATRVRRGFWDKMRAHAAGVPFAEDAVASYYAAFDRQTPLKVRATLLAALAYFVLPVDLTPDFLPLIGFSDDAAVLMGALRLLSSHVQPYHYAAARDALDRLRGETD